MSALAWTFTDALTITRRSVWHWARQPYSIIFGLLFPIMMAVMFGLLFGGSITVPGGGSYFDYLMPGMFVMTMAFGIGETMVAVNADKDKGVTDRFRSMPMAAAAVLFGRTIADMIYSVMLLVVLTGFGLAVGWRSHDGIGNALAAVGLLLLLRFAVVWIGVYIGLTIKSEEMVGTVHTMLFPITFITNIFADPATMPGWLGAIAAWNPLSSTVTATRELFGNPATVADTWIGQHALLMAIVWPIAITAVFFTLSVRSYRKLSS